MSCKYFKIMRKSIISASIFLILGGFVSCTESGNIPESAETVTGFYTINGGNKSGNVPASITAYDYNTGVA